jgi:hypothetical protein
MSRAWSQHPNARYLDWILHDYFDHGDFWSGTPDWMAYDLACYYIYQSNANSQLWLGFRRALVGPTMLSESRIALGAGAALIAWPESSDLFHVPSEKIAVLAELGYPGAAMMKNIIPALPRFHEYQQLIHG